MADAEMLVDVEPGVVWSILAASRPLRDTAKASDRRENEPIAITLAKLPVNGQKRIVKKIRQVAVDG